MNILDVLKNNESVKNISQESDLILADVSREEIAAVATKLAIEHEFPLSLLFCTDERIKSDSFEIHVVFSDVKSHQRAMITAAIPASNPVCPSITKTVMAAHWYERYVDDMFGVIPEGHPDLRRLVNHENIPDGTHPLRKDFAWNAKLDKANVEYPMHHVEGEGVYEIPVGPIHAGIIEPGHFRFNVAGERILTLEGKLFFTHKGVEKLLEGKTVDEALPFIERLSGDMAASNALAFVQAVEAISGCDVPKRALMLRALVCELERITMHIHDLANIGGMGTGYSFIAANGFRIKERLMRLSAKMLNNRFWRGYILPGGVARDLSGEELGEILDETKSAYEEMRRITDIALASEGFLDRLQYTGKLPKEAALALGAVGLPARASGVDRDVRRDFPYGAYKEFPISIATKKSSDVFARYRIRILEMEYSMEYIKQLLENIEEGSILEKFEIKDGFAIGAVESWRGEILCAVRVRDGVIDRCFPRDPSFCNWPLFGIIGPGNIVPDFPLCNKSLNLSYSGTDM